MTYSSPLLLLSLLSLLLLSLPSLSLSQEEVESFPLQTGPFASLLGQELHALELISETEGQLVALPIDAVLGSAKVVGLYFSADW